MRHHETEQDALDHDDFLHGFINERYDVTDPTVLALLRPEDLAEEAIIDILAQEAELHPECLALAPFARTLPQAGDGHAPDQKDDKNG